VSPARKLIRTSVIVGAILAGLFVTTVLVAASIWPTINRVETGQSIEYPDLRVRTFQLGYDRVYNEALAAAKDQDNWLVTGEDRAKGHITAIASMPVLGWTQDISIQVERKTAFVSRVGTLSEGHDAPGDLGQNARNIRDFQASLDDRLGAARVPDPI
jgi:hypothetical protein